MSRFKKIDWFNIVLPIVLGIVLGVFVSAWGFMAILSGVLYGTVIYRLTEVMEAIGEGRFKYYHCQFSDRCLVAELHTPDQCFDYEQTMRFLREEHRD